MRTLDGFKKGVNLGGWLSQGPLDKEHLDTFITEKDIARIASWGLDHVRLPIDYDNFENEDGTDKEGGYAYIDSCIEWCRKYNLNMVLDLHKKDSQDTPADICTRHMDIYLTTRLIFLNSSMRNLFRIDSMEYGENS